MTEPLRPKEPPLVYDYDLGTRYQRHEMRDIPRWVELVSMTLAIFAGTWIALYWIPWMMNETTVPALTLDSSQFQGVFNCPDSTVMYGSPTLEFDLRDGDILHVQFDCFYKKPIE